MNLLHSCMKEETYGLIFLWSVNCFPLFSIWLNLFLLFLEKFCLVISLYLLLVFLSQISRLVNGAFLCFFFFFLSFFTGKK